MVEIVKKQVRAISFVLISPEKIKKIASAKIITPELYDVDGYPVDGGLMDLRLGAIDPGVRCRTCGGRLKECLGHPGIIELARPVIHIKYLPIIDLVLRSTCEACGKILIKDEKTAGAPDAYLVLPWNFLPELLRKMKGYIQNGGVFIVPVPKPMVIDKGNYKKELHIF